MNYTIESKDLQVTVSSLGAQLQSVIGKKTGTEYLWQGNPEFWQSRATVLFPICGRLYEGKYTYNGIKYEMTLHGFSKLFEHNVFKKTDNEIQFILTQSEETKKIYPFDFTLKIGYAINGNKITQSFTVENATEEDLPFSIGGHPGFNVPFIEGEKFEDYYVEFKNECKPKRLCISENGLYLDKKVNFPLASDKILNLKHSLFDDDAIFLTDFTSEVTLKSKTNNQSITVSFEKGSFINLGFWHSPKKEAPFLCIEPWCGIPAYEGKRDDFATKNQMMHLKKGETYLNSFDITVNE